MVADERISDLPDGGAARATDLFAAARGTGNVKVAGSQLAPGGWVDDTTETWTYASGSGGGTATFTVAGDQTAKYTPGTRIKLTQSAAVAYFVVAAASFAASTTTVTITGGSDYTLANSAITANFHSYDANPQGYPGWFNYTSGATGFSGFTTNHARFAVDGRTVHLRVYLLGTSNSTATAANLPISCSSLIQVIWAPIRCRNNGTVSTAPGMCAIDPASPTVVTFLRDLTGAGWTASGSKEVNLTVDYEI